jgi:hypothetical protein
MNRSSRVAFLFSGWLELDLIMGTWAEENLEKLDQTNLEHVRTSNAARIGWIAGAIDRVIDSALSRLSILFFSSTHTLLLRRILI